MRAVTPRVVVCDEGSRAHTGHSAPGSLQTRFPPDASARRLVRQVTGTECAMLVAGPLPEAGIRLSQPWRAAVGQ